MVQSTSPQPYCVETAPRSTIAVAVPLGNTVKLALTFFMFRILNKKVRLLYDGGFSTPVGRYSATTGNVCLIAVALLVNVVCEQNTTASQH